MQSRSWRLLGLVLGIGLAAGCKRDNVEYVEYDEYEVDYDDDDDDRRVIVHEDVHHVHDRSCNHYHDGGTWYVVRAGHVHGPGCGHSYEGTYWVRERTVERARPPRHVHGDDCGCVYDRDRGRWLKIKGSHVHRRGCGHVYADGRWCVTVSR